jgi:hypothetical protein
VVPEVTLSLAIYDYLPMLIWGAGSYFLVDAIRKDINAGISYYTLILSLVLIWTGGFLKATWKLLIAIANANLIFLSDIQFPLMGAGFFLLFISLLPFLLQKKDIQKKSFAIGAFQKFFLPLLVIGSIGSTVCLILIAKRKKAFPALIFYAIFLVTSTSMGYIGSQIVATSYKVILIEQTLNCSSTLMWALGSFFLWKSLRRAGIINSPHP